MATKPATKRFQYQERDAESVKKRAEQDGGTFDSILMSGVDTWRPKQGENTIRFLPPTWPDPEHYGFDVWVHSYVGPENGTYLCPKKMLNKRCPVCEAHKEALDAGEEEEAKQLKVKKQVAAWIIDRDDDANLPQVYIMSWSMDRDIAALCHNKKAGKVLMIDNPETGYDVTFKRTGQQLKTRYIGIAIDREASPLFESQKEINKVMAIVDDKPIPDILAYKDTEYLEAMIEGKPAKGDEDDDDDDKPRRKPKRPAADDDDDEPAPKRRRPAADDADDEDEKPAKRKRPAADDDDDDADEKPAKRKRPAADDDDDADEKPAKRRRVVEEEVDDEDEKPAKRKRPAADDDDDDADEKPAKRKRPVADEDDADDEPAPAKRKRPAAADDDDDEPAPKRKRPAASDDDDDADEKPAKRKRPVADDDDDDEPAPRKRR